MAQEFNYKFYSHFFNAKKESVDKKLIDHLISSKFFKDGKSLKKRISNIFRFANKQINTILSNDSRSIKQKLVDVKKFLFNKADSEFIKNNPSVQLRNIKYNLKRNYVTYGNLAYKETLRDCLLKNSYCTHIKYISALIHNKTCDTCRKRHNKIYKIEDAPLDHPNGFCKWQPIQIKSDEGIRKEFENDTRKI